MERTAKKNRLLSLDVFRGMIDVASLQEEYRDLICAERGHPCPRV